MKKLVIPKKLGECADLLYRLRKERLALQKEVEEYEKHESALREHIIQTLPKSEASGVAGRVARVSVTTQLVPQLKDFAALFAYVKKTGSLELLQRRINNRAVQERWEAKKQVPGVEAFRATMVSLNKL